MRQRKPQAALRFFGLIVIMIAAGALAPALAQPTAGAIHGRVTDKDKKPILGAAMSLTGTSIQGMRECLTSAAGVFHFPELPPGIYELRTEMPGFKTQIRPGLAIEAGRSVRVTVELEATANEEEVVLTLPSPMIDMSSAAARVNLGRALLAALPLGRDLDDIVKLAPGAVSEGRVFDRATSILGGTVRGQRFLLDAGSGGDPDTTYAVADFNVDAFEQVEFISAGQAAEIGQAQSSLVNIIARAGGNTREGDLTAYYTGSGLAKDLFSPGAISGMSVAPAEKFDDYRDFAFNLGGSLWENRVWVFLNARKVTWDKTNPYAPEGRMAELGILNSPHFGISRREWMGFFKLTIEPVKELRYTGFVNYGRLYEPYNETSLGPGASSDSVPIRDYETSFLTAHQFDYTFNPNTSVQIRGTFGQRGIPLVSRAASTAYSYYDFARQASWGTTAYNQDQTRKTLNASASMTSIQDGLMGAEHEFKFGVEYESGESHIDWYRGNPYSSLWYDWAAKNPYMIDPVNKIGRLSILPAPGAAGVWDVEDDSRRISGYFQDTLKKGRLALNLGLRIEYAFQAEPLVSRPELSYGYGPENQASGIAAGAFLTALINTTYTDAGLKSPWNSFASAYKKTAEFVTFSPRLGAVLDVFGDGSTALKMSFARYFEPIWTGKYSAGQIFAPQSVQWDWYDLNGNGLMDLPGTDKYVLVSSVPQVADATYTEYTDGAGVKHTLKAPYTDEFSIGLERELFKDFNLGLRFLYRRDKNIVEDVDIVNGYDPTATDAEGLIWLPLSVIDPGRDGVLGTADDRALTVYGLRADRPAPEYKATNPPEAERKFWAMIFTFDKRLAGRWQFSGSVVYSSFRGNVGAGNDASLGMTPMFNTPNSLTNAYGPLAFDRPLQVQLMASWVLPFDFVLGAHYHYLSGAPYARTLSQVYFPADYMGYGTRAPYYTVLAEALGVGRYPATSILDLRLEKSFSAGQGKKFALSVDAFNVLGDSGVLSDLDPSGILRADLAAATYAAGSTYGRVYSVYGVRSFRLGAKYSF